MNCYEGPWIVELDYGYNDQFIEEAHGKYRKKYRLYKTNSNGNLSFTSQGTWLNSCLPPLVIARPSTSAWDISVRCTVYCSPLSTLISATNYKVAQTSAGMQRR